MIVDGDSRSFGVCMTILHFQLYCHSYAMDVPQHGEHHGRQQSVRDHCGFVHDLRDELAWEEMNWNVYLIGKGFLLAYSHLLHHCRQLWLKLENQNRSIL